MRRDRYPALVLAGVATGTSVCMSMLAGWQRGGSLAERLAWTSIGVVLVVNAHLLPAQLRDASPVVRGTGCLLWAACMVTACYGHATFVLLAQQHAGEQRAAAVTVAPAPPSSRSLTTVMAERAAVTARLATASARTCAGHCATLEGRRVTLAAKLDALEAEAGDIRRQQVAQDRGTAQRDALLADPVTSRLAALLGTTTARVDLLSGLAFAAVLEGIACLLWTVALRPPPQPVPARIGTAPEVAPPANVAAVTQGTVTTVTAGHAHGAIRHETITDSHTPGDDPVMPLPDGSSPDDDVAALVRDIAAGRVRPTVASIRRHLGCSQARAAALRKQIVKSST